MNTRRIARISMIAATYAACTLVAMLFLGWMAWGPVQFRISEALVVLALFTADAIPGLTLGCVIANVANIALSGVGTLGLLDVVFGSLATLLGAMFTWHFRNRPALALLGPVIANGLIVPAYLPFMLQGLGFYTIPFTSIDLEGAYVPMYLFGLVATSFGEAVVMYVLGLPLYHALEKTPLVSLLADESGYQQAYGEERQ
jgi:uncharacterized membrane protein